MAQDGTIILDLDEAVETNHTIILYEHCDLAPAMKEEWVTIQFGSFEPVMILLMVPMTLMEVEHVQGIPDKDNEGWTLVARRRPRKQM